MKSIYLCWFVSATLFVALVLGVIQISGSRIPVDSSFVTFIIGLAVVMNVGMSGLIVVLADKDENMQKPGSFAQLHRQPLIWGGVQAGAAAMAITFLCGFAQAPADAAVYILLRVAVIAFIAGAIGASVSYITTPDPRGTNEASA